MIKTIIVDDHPLVIEGLKRILNSEDIKVSVEGEATDSRKLFNALETISPDIIILDIELPEKNGLDILKDLRKRYLQIPVLMLSMYPADRFAVRSFQAGASGYLTKKSIPEEIEKALKMIVYENKKYITA
ncbi:MAG: response regulator transcription factor, partial [Balneolaceae bacterium]